MESAPLPANRFCTFALTGRSSNIAAFDEVDCLHRLGELRLCENCATICHADEAVYASDDYSDIDEQGENMYILVPMSSSERRRSMPLLKDSLELLESRGLSEENRLKACFINRCIKYL